MGTLTKPETNDLNQPVLSRKQDTRRRSWYPGTTFSSGTGDGNGRVASASVVYRFERARYRSKCRLGERLETVH